MNLKPNKEHKMYDVRASLFCETLKSHLEKAKPESEVAFYFEDAENSVPLTGKVKDLIVDSTKGIIIINSKPPREWNRVHIIQASKILWASFSVPKESSDEVLRREREETCHCVFEPKPKGQCVKCEEFLRMSNDESQT